MKREFNNIILSQASKLKYTIASLAPSTAPELFQAPSLVIWDGASDNTIWNDSKVNYAFRALHDSLHLKTGIGFSPSEEIALGRIQANQYTGLLADLVYIEVAEQAAYYLHTGNFVDDQVKFTIDRLKALGYKL